MSDKLEALKAKKPVDTKSLKSQAAGYVTDDNSGGYYVVECQECGEVYPSQQSGGGGQIADTGDYDDSYCPHCGYVDPDECDNVGLVWNVQQAKINALLAALETMKAKTSTTMGVGNGSGNLFVYGDYDSIKAAQRIVLENEKLRAALEEKDQELDKEGDILIDTQESMREWKLRANAAEQREEHLKADAAVMGERIANLEVTQMTGPLSLVLKRAAELERIIEGVDQLAIDGGWTARKMSEYAKSLETRNAELEQRLQQPIKLPKGFSHQDGAPHALLGAGDVMISHIKWGDAQGIAFAPMPAGKAGIGVNVDADVAGKSSDEIGAVFVVKATSVQSLEVLKEAVQMAIDGFKAKVEGE